MSVGSDLLNKLYALISVSYPTVATIKQHLLTGVPVFSIEVFTLFVGAKLYLLHHFHYTSNCLISSTVHRRFLIFAFHTDSPTGRTLIIHPQKYWSTGGKANKTPVCLLHGATLHGTAPVDHHYDLRTQSMLPVRAVNFLRWRVNNCKSNTS